MDKLKISISKIFNMRNVTILVSLLLFGLICYTVGYDRSYEENIVAVAKSENIPQQCVATHNYCITLNNVIHDLKRGNAACLEELESAREDIKTIKETLKEEEQ